MISNQGKQRRLRSIGVIGLSAAMVLASCGSDDDSAAVTTAAPGTTAAPDATTATVDLLPDGCDSLVVGAILSLNGNFSQLGSDSKIAIDAFYQTHTEVLGVPIKVQIENDRSDPTASAEAATRLSSDPCVIAITGPNVTATMVSAFPVLKESGLPIIVNTPVPYPGYNTEPLVFSPNLTPIPMQQQDFVDYFDALGVTNPVFVTGDDATGDAVQGLYESRGLIVARVPLAVTDFEPQLAQLRDAGHDGVAYVGSGGQPPAFVARGLDALGWDVPLLLAPSNLTADFLNVAGPAGESARGFIWPAGAGVDMFADNADQQMAVEEVRAAVPAEYDLAIRPNIAYNWDNHASLYNAIIQAQSVDPDELGAVLESQNFWGANGQVIRIPVGQEGADHAGVQVESAMRAVVRDGKVIVADDVPQK
jgi:ABC-type branched-subunit amino acid transport system substrate-binding protein